MSQTERTISLIHYLSALPDVMDVQLYGSYRSGTADNLSDLDIAVTVTGDNGLFALTLPAKMNEFRDVLFADYAPSLAPEKYVLTLCLFPDMPFFLVDITVRAEPHCSAVTKAMLSDKNDDYAHLCKLFCANLKHYLRDTAAGMPLSCVGDIRKMWKKMCQKTALPLEESCTEAAILRCTFEKLYADCPPYRHWLDGFAPYIPDIP